jgi:hypothetical protein
MMGIGHRGMWRSWLECWRRGQGSLIVIALGGDTADAWNRGLGLIKCIGSWKAGRWCDRVGSLKLIRCVYLGAGGTIESWEAGRGCDRLGHLS